LRVEPVDLWPAKDKLPSALQDFFERLSPAWSDAD
jgi:hypothetical protein